MPNEQYVKQVLDKLSIDNIDEKLKVRLEKAVEDTFDKLEDNLSKDAYKAILQILGFEQRWSDFLEIDHCNGRSGNSFIMDELKPVLKPIAKDMVSKLVKEIDFTHELADKRKVEIIQSFKKTYEREFDRAISDKIEGVRSQARKDVEAIFPHIVQTLYGKSIDELKADLMVEMLTKDESNLSD